MGGPERDGAGAPAAAGPALPVSTYAEFFLLGLGNGGVFAALAMALVVTYRASGVLNFATGAQALYAAYTYSLLRTGQLLVPIPGLGPTVNVGTSWGFWPALLVTLAIPGRARRAGLPARLPSVCATTGRWPRRSPPSGSWVC